MSHSWSTEQAEGRGPLITGICPAEVPIPVDLTQWMSRAVILQLVLDELDELSEKPCTDAVGHSLTLNARWRILGALLGLAYCTHQYTSSEIVAFCHSDQLFQAICSESLPFVQELEHFRRTQRPVLESLLAGVFTRAVLKKFGAEQLSPALSIECHRRAEELLSIARHMNTWDE